MPTLPKPSMRLASLALATLAFGGNTLRAAETDAGATAGTVEEVVVVAYTGSRVKRHAASPSPLSEYHADELADHAIKDVRDLIGRLPTNSGAENNSDNLTQNFTAGTANINLRGLGVAATLVLLNGKRQVLSAVQTDDGASFVDLAALTPLLAIERVEILKDGASAIYGSDAVAGVANFITKRDYEGAELQVEYRNRVSDGSQDDVYVDGVVGGTFSAGGSYLLAASHLDRSSLLLGEVDWLRPATSGFGNPASFNVPSLGRTVADPDCERYDGLLQTLANGSTLCRFDFGPQITAVPEEQRTQAFAGVDWPTQGGTRVWAEVGYARNDVRRDVSPSFPVLNTPLVPARHPANPFGEDVHFQGRPYGFGYPPEINYYQHDTGRLAFGFAGDTAGGLAWDASYVWAANDAVLNPRDVIGANFQAALLGFGGAGCDTRPTAVHPPRPGEGACRYFNPFSSAFSAQPGEATHNDPALKRFIIGDYLGDAESELQTIEANLTGELWTMRNGAVGFAVGAQWRDQSLGTTYDAITQGDGFAFLIGNTNFSGALDSHALYGEVWLPVAPWLEVTGALRFEDYGGAIGDTWDPKLALFATPSPTLSLRASFGTSFRAPSPFQTHGAQTNFVNITDHDGATTFAGRRTLGDPALQPETSRALNVGASWAFHDDMELDIDYWDYAFEDVLRKENAQAIVNADPFDPRIERTSAGTVAIVNAAFINADAIDTRGVDFHLHGRFDTRLGVLAPYIEGTVVLAYDVTNAGRRVDGLGRLNRANVGAPNQRFKAVAGLGVERDDWAANLQVRHVGGYEDDQGGDINGFTTVDANLRFDFGERFWRGVGASVMVGVVNLADQDPPYVAVAGSYDVRSADPRGRRVFARLALKLAR